MAWAALTGRTTRCDGAQAMLRRLKANPSESMGSFRTEVADLRKFAVLNYIAVIKCAGRRGCKSHRGPGLACSLHVLQHPCHLTACS